MLQKFKEKVRKYTFSELVQIFDYKFGLGRIEMILASHWFNPFATFWLNFRSLQIKQAIRFPIAVYGRPKFYCLSGNIILKGKIKFGMLKFNTSKPGRPSFQNLQSELCNLGTIVCQSGYIGCGNKIFVGNAAKLEIGDDIGITDMVNIGCLNHILIGNRVSITQRCQIMDSNYHLIADFRNGVVQNDTRPVQIGNGCWIGNSSTVNGGSNLPNFTIVASNSLVNKSSYEIPENSIIGGIPAKLIATGYRRIYKEEFINSVRLHYCKYSNTFKIPQSWEIDECSDYKTDIKK